MFAIRLSTGRTIGKVYLSVLTAHTFDFGRTPKTWKTQTGANKALTALCKILDPGTKLEDCSYVTIEDVTLPIQPDNRPLAKPMRHQPLY